MNEYKKPTLIIPLGLSVASMPTFSDLIERARRQVSLVACGQESLTYLENKDFILRTRLDIKNGQFELNAKIPVKAQADMFGHASQSRRHQGFDRNDNAEQKAVDETIDAVKNSSNLLDRVAHAMNNISNLKEALQDIERREGVVTRPARRHIQSKQPNFLVEVEDVSIRFNAHDVRVAVAHPDPFNIYITLSDARDHNLLTRGLITCINNDSGASSVTLGGVAEFRFVGLDGWRKLIIEAARWLNIPLRIVALKSISTCTLNSLPIEIQEVENWDELMMATIEALLEIQKDINDRRVSVQRDAA